MFFIGLLSKARVFSSRQLINLSAKFYVEYVFFRCDFFSIAVLANAIGLVNLFCVVSRAKCFICCNISVRMIVKTQTVGKNPKNPSSRGQVG